MLLSGQQQATYLLLQAWQIELSRARTAAALDNPSIVAGKFAFWRDVVGRGQRTEHPIADGLQTISRQYRWPVDLVMEMVGAKVGPGGSCRKT